MPTFSYTALDKQGKNVKGVLEGDSPQAIRQTLRDKHLIPVNVDEITKSVQKSGKKYKLKSSQLALITRQLATLFEAKLPIEKALQGVSEQTEKPNAKSILLSVREKVLEGHSLAQSLRQFPNTFPELYCATVAAGEQTGNLDLVLNRLADYNEKQQETKQKIQQALIYPSVMVVVSVSIISFLLTFVVPKIIGVFNSTGQQLPQATIILIGISDFLKAYGIYCALLCVALIALLKRLLKKASFRFKWDSLMLRFPLVSYMIKTVNTARFSHTLAILSSAGVPILKAMKIATSLISNAVIKESVATASMKVKEGASLSGALKSTKVFSPMALHLIASGENSGRLETMLKHAAKTQDQDVNRVIDTGLTLFEPIIILLMGGMVLFIVLATLLPIFSMDQLVH